VSTVTHRGEARISRARRREHLPPAIATAVAALALIAIFAPGAPASAAAATVDDGSHNSAAAPAGGRGAEELSPADADGRFVHLVEFTEPGLLRRQPPAPRARFDAKSEAAQAGLLQIQREQALHLEAISRAVGAVPEVTHYFLVTHSGIAARLTPEEAHRVRAVPGVKSVERERVFEMDTYRGPTFIGADKIWDGTAVPSTVGTRGAGMIIGGLDGGVSSTHPSFANDVTNCGHGTTNPVKLLSFLDCATTDGSGMCNGPNPEDTDGHGTHTASTAGGNTVNPGPNPAPLLTVSGVAPCASIRAYKVCPTNQCPGAAIQAGMDSVLLHGDVDVMNFSISGGTDPWNDNDRKKLDVVGSGVFVAASAGNTSATITDPVGQVNHRGAWVFTVAASTHDGASALVSASGPGTPPLATQNIAVVRGSASVVGTLLNDHPIKHYTLQDPTMEGCTPGEDGVPPSANPFPAGFFTGGGALIHRGTCPFTKKVTNAFNAGANLVLIRNNQATPVSMNTTGQPAVVAYSMDQTPGNALVAFVDANPASATVDFVPKGDTLAGFSFRGPTPAPLADLQKPDITGPGVTIYAGVPVVADPTGFASISGTSMSSPHAAGAATLVRAVHPDWTPPEVKSALMMTAFTGGTKEDGVTPWNTDDVGSGRLDLTKAALSGVVLNETFANFLAADPSSAGDVKTLNLAAVRDVTCTPNCTWTRTVRNTSTSASSWTVAGNVPDGSFGIEVSPTAFSFTGTLVETQVLTIKATPHIALAALAFGDLVLSDGAGPSPDLRITAVIQGTGTNAMFSDGFESGNADMWSDCDECP